MKTFFFNIKLENQEEVFEEIINSINDLICEIDENGNFSFVNDEYERIMGYKPAELLGKSPIFLIHPEDKDKAIKKIKELHEKKTSSTDVWRFKNKDNTYKYYECRSIIISSGNGKNKMIVISKDITDKKVFENELKELNEKYNRILNHISDLICEIDPNGIITFVSNNFEKTTGYKPVELLGEYAGKLFHPEDFERAKGKLGELIKYKGTSTDIWRAKHKNGNYRFYESTASIVCDNDKIVSIVVVSKDITDKVKIEEALLDSERLLKDSQKSAKIGHYVLDVKTGNWFGSEMLYELFGITGAFERNVEGWLSIVHPDEREYLKKYLLDHVVKDKNKFDYTYKIVRYDNKDERWVHGLGELKFDTKGNTIEMFGTIQDVTSHKLAEIEIHKLNESLEERVKERTKELESFTYTISHDLRAPLRAIIGFSEMLKEEYIDKLDNEGLRFCNIIKENTLKMSQLIDDLLTFSRINRIEIQNSIIDMKSIAESVINELSAAYEKIKYSVKIGDLPDIKGDPEMIKQVWVNLISNALKFSSKNNNPEILIGFEMKESGKEFFIKDNGVGFDMKYEKKIFGIFERLYPKDFDGTGVGLAIVERIIKKHNGKIWAESSPSKGTVFYFTIPD